MESLAIKVKRKLKELGYYEYSNYLEGSYKKKLNMYCNLHIELEMDTDFKKDNLIHSAYVESIFIIHEQRIIDEIQKAYNQLQEDLKQLEVL